jgi:hypothetical protein
LNELGVDANDLREWSPPRTAATFAIDRLWLTVVLVVPGLVVASLGAIAFGIPGAVAGAVVYSVLVWLWLSSQGRRALRASGARPAESTEAPRLFNLAHGMASDLGLEPPGLWLVDDGGPNAMACRAGGPVLVVNRSLLDSFTRTELEAVVAHCLVRLHKRELHRSALAAALGELAGPAGGVDLIEVDARAASLTRYPAGLAAAISKAAPRSGRMASFWFVPGGSRWPAPADREARLGEL